MDRLDRIEKLLEQSAKNKAVADRERIELRRQIANTSAQLAKTDAQLAKTDAQLAKTDALVRRTDQIWGAVAEGIALGEVVEVLNELPGIEVDDYAANVKNHKRGNFEIDAVAVGDHCVVLMEARARLRKGAIHDFIAKFKRYLEHYPQHRDKHIYGLVAFLNVDSDAKALAIEEGLLVIRSDYVNKEVINPPPKFVLRDFNPKREVSA